MLVTEKELSRIERMYGFHVSFESKVTSRYPKKGTVVRKSLLNGIPATEGLNDLRVKRTVLLLCGANKRCSRLIAELNSDIEYLRAAVVLARLESE